MNGVRSVFEWCAWGITFLCMATASSQDDPEEREAKNADWSGRPLVVAVQSDDLVDARRVREIVRLVERAAEEEVSAVVLELDLSGSGAAGERQRVLDALSKSKLPIIAYVNTNATGPGALLALAADSIYVHPSSIIGGAGVVLETDEEDSDSAARKRAAAQEQSVLKARARSLARQNGHREDIAEAMVDGEVEVTIGEEILSPKGEVLTLTAGEAVRQFEGKPLLAKAEAESLSELLSMEKLDSEAIRFTPREYGESSNRERLSKGKNESRETEASDDEGEEGGRAPLFGRREEGSYAGKVVVLKVGQDTLATGKASFDFMDRTIKKAELDGAAALIFDMDTPGGFAWYTEGLVLNSLQNISYPTYTFVNSRAESAGAIIALGTDHIYMRPAATIGSALVVSGTGQDLAEAMADKVTQMIIGTVRNIAELKGHNPDVAEAFVTREKEVKIDGIVVHEAGNVLNLNTIEATEEIGGRPVLAKGVANSLEEILEAEGIEGEIVNAEPLGMEAFAHWVQKLSILLIVVGLAGAYLELNSPGFGLPGLVSVLAFGLFFFGNYLAGNLAGYELAVLLVVGLILIAVEIFVFPGAILPGAVGGALVFVALGLAMVDRVDLEWKWTGLPGAESWAGLFRQSLIALAVGMVGAFGVVIAGMRFLPETRLGSRLILQEAIDGGAAIGNGREGEDSEAEKSLVGREGTASTDLVPSGKGRFGSDFLDVVSDGTFVERGTPLRILRHEGSRIVVEPISDDVV